jgi:hypothetical protein
MCMVDYLTKICFQVYKNYLNWSYAQIIFPSGFTGYKILNKDTNVWLNGAIPPNECYIAQFDSTVGRLDYFLLGNSANVHGVSSSYCQGIIAKHNSLFSLKSFIFHIINFRIRATKFAHAN